MSELLRSRLPEGMTIPVALESAWEWMEAQGWGVEDSAGYTVEPLGSGKSKRVASGGYVVRTHGGDSDHGVLFTPDAVIPEPYLSTVSRYEPGGPGHDRLLPIGVSGDWGEVVALWLDDAERVRFVELTPMGPKLIADNVKEFLDAVTSSAGPFSRGESLNGERELEPSALEDHSALRSWAEETFGVSTPDEWVEPEQDSLEEWDRLVKQRHSTWLQEKHNAESSAALAAFATALPDKEELERRFRVLAIMEAILTDHTFKYTYARSFPGRPERVGRYDNGAGDDIYAFFGDEGAFVRAFDHEDEASPYATGNLWPGLLVGIPEQFAPVVHMSEIEDEDWDADEDPPSITLALWSVEADWQYGSIELDEDGHYPEPTTWMFHLLAGAFTVENVADDLGRYFGRALAPSALKPFMNLEPLTRANVLALNPRPNWETLTLLAGRGGYPSDLGEAASYD